MKSKSELIITVELTELEADKVIRFIKHHLPLTRPVALVDELTNSVVDELKATLEMELE